MELQRQKNGGVASGRERLEGILRRAQQNVADHQYSLSLAQKYLKEAQRRLYDAEDALAAYDRAHDAD